MLRLLKTLFLFPLYYRLLDPCKSNKCIVRMACTKICQDRKKYDNLRFELTYQYYITISIIKRRYGPISRRSIIDQTMEIFVNVLLDATLLLALLCIIYVILGELGLINYNP